jgi:hypothetical protein
VTGGKSQTTDPAPIAKLRNWLAHSRPGWSLPLERDEVTAILNAYDTAKIIGDQHGQY